MKFPKNDDKYQWTEHVKGKMVYYGMSASLIKRIVRFPKRKEEGVAPRTTAVMQPTSGKKPQEVWVMLQEIQSEKRRAQNDVDTLNEKRVRIGLNGGSKLKNFLQPKMRIISAWRYPGISPINKPIPIPDEILQELNGLLE